MSQQKKELYFFTSDHVYDPKYVIESMLGGVDILLVDPAIFPEISRLLADYLAEAKAQRDRDNIEKLEYFISYINEEPERQRIAKLLEKPEPKPVIKPPVLTEEQIEEEIRVIWEKHKIRNFTENELDLVIARMRQKSAEYISQGNYLDAQKADHFAKILISHGQLGAVENMQCEKVNDLRQKLEDSKKELIDNKANWERLYSNLRTAAREEFDKMKAEHMSQIQELEDMKAGQPPVHIRKYSNALLQLRRREQAYVQNRDFKKAADVKAAADDMQKEEDEVHRCKWGKEVDLKIKNLMIVQANQVKVRKAYWRNEEMLLVNEANKDVKQSEKAIAHLERNLKIAEQAKDIATNLREETRHVAKEEPAAKGLPRLRTARATPQKKGADFRQRQILNKKIYTRVPKSQCISPRHRKPL